MGNVVGCGVQIAAVRRWVRMQEERALPYLLAFLKQIGQNLGRSPFLEGYRLGTGCDLHYSSWPAN